MYKYFLRKTKVNYNDAYIPMIRHDNKWKYLIRNNDKFMVSNRNYYTFNKPLNAYKFLAIHRVLKSEEIENYNAQNRHRCVFFNEFITFVPLFGIIYFLFMLLNRKVDFKYMFSDNKSFYISVVLNSFYFIGFLLFLIL